GLLGNFDKAGGAGDVDLGDVIADDVEPDQQQAAAGNFLPDGGGDFLVAVTERLGNAPPAGRQIAPRFTGQRNACQRIGNRLACNEQYALVAFDDLGNVALGHDGALPVFGQGFQNGAQ